jgi:hypothetical protein
MEGLGVMVAKTGWPPGLLQDDCRALSKWFAGRLGARQQIKERFMNMPTMNLRFVEREEESQLSADGYLLAHDVVRVVKRRVLQQQWAASLILRTNGVTFRWLMTPNVLGEGWTKGAAFWPSPRPTG